MYQLKNQYGDLLGTYSKLGNARRQAEQYFQCGVAESLNQMKSEIERTGTASASLIVKESIRCWITKC